MLICKELGRVHHLQNLIFSVNNSIENSYFFWCLILDVIFWDFGASWYQNCRFWDPPVQNGSQNRLSGARNLKFMKSRSAFFGKLEPTCSQGRFLSAPGHHFFGCLMNFWPFCLKIWSIVYPILGTNFGYCFARRLELACWLIPKLEQQKHQ